MQAVLEYSAMAKFNTKEEFIEDNLFDFIEEYCENILAQDEDIEVEVLRKDEKGVNIRFIPQDIAVILDNVISNSIKYNATLFVTHHLNKRDETMGSVGLNADVSGILTLKESKNNYNKLTLMYKGRDSSRLELNIKR